MNRNGATSIRNHETVCTVKNRSTTVLCIGIVCCAIFGGMLCAVAGGFLPNQRIVSTVPSNGDLNPYGVAFVPEGFHQGAGPLRPGDILVSNFNNNMNLQGLALPLCVFLQAARSQLSLLGHLTRVDHLALVFLQHSQFFVRASRLLEMYLQQMAHAQQARRVRFW